MHLVELLERSLSLRPFVLQFSCNYLVVLAVVLPHGFAFLFCFLPTGPLLS